MIKYIHTVESYEILKKKKRKHFMYLIRMIFKNRLLNEKSKVQSSMQNMVPPVLKRKIHDMSKMLINAQIFLDGY